MGIINSGYNAGFFLTSSPDENGKQFLTSAYSKWNENISSSKVRVKNCTLDDLVVS